MYSVYFWSFLFGLFIFPLLVCVVFCIGFAFESICPMEKILRPTFPEVLLDFCLASFLFSKSSHPKKEPAVVTLKFPSCERQIYRSQSVWYSVLSHQFHLKLLSLCVLKHFSISFHGCVEFINIFLWLWTTSSLVFLSFIFLLEKYFDLRTHGGAFPLL